MGNTTLFHKAKYDANKIYWHEIFSESLKKHTGTDLDHALAAGTNYNMTSEYNMLENWDKPWVWFSALKIGIIGILVVYSVYFMFLYGFGVTSTGFTALMFVVPPLVIPLVVLTFLWELNIPKNISLRECLAWFFLGGIGSLVITIIGQMIISPAEIISWFSNLGLPHSSGTGSSAPFFEEPAKLLAAIVIINLVSKKKKIYGITGLVIGACVGTGFSAFESVGYAFDYSESVVSVQIIRALSSPGGHIVWCALYCSAIAYHMKDNKLSVSCFANKDFSITFIAAFVLHYAWNTFGGYIVLFGLIIAAWICLLYMLRKCLNQLVLVGNYSHTKYQGSIAGQGYGNKNELIISCEKGKINGKAWKSGANDILTIGRAASNMIIIPDGAVSRVHCVFRKNGGKWLVQDLNSSHGTYLNKTKLVPEQYYSINNGDILTIPSNLLRLNLY